MSRMYKPIDWLICANNTPESSGFRLQKGMQLVEYMRPKYPCTYSDLVSQSCTDTATVRVYVCMYMYINVTLTEACGISRDLLLVIREYLCTHA